MKTALPRAAAAVRHCWHPQTEEEGTEVTQVVQADTSAAVETYCACVNKGIRQRHRIRHQ
jgi:hypothetical protein